MIASRAHGFIFFKTRKTAGTSIEIALTPHCGGKDILTPLAYEDELLRSPEGLLAARNYSFNKPLVKGFSDAYRDSKIKKYQMLMRRLARSQALFNHIPAKRLKKKLAPALWASAWKFTIERHPYEKVVSDAFYHYHYLLLRLTRQGRDEKQPTFSRYLDFFIGRMTPDRGEAYAIDGTVVVDEVIFQESLEEQLRDVAKRLGLPLSEIPRAKGQFRKDPRPAREILTDAQKEAIFLKHRTTFERFGYQS